MSGMSGSVCVNMHVQGLTKQVFRYILSVIALSCALLPRVQVKAGWLHQDQEPLRRTGGASLAQAGGVLQTGAR